MRDSPQLLQIIEKATEANITDTHVKVGWVLIAFHNPFWQLIHHLIWRRVFWYCYAWVEILISMSLFLAPFQVRYTVGNCA